MSARSSRRPQHVPAISRLTVAGIKSIWDEVSIEIRPLTIIAGENSAGKSTIMQSLLLLKQSLQSKHDPGPLLLNGEHVKFTQWEQLLARKTSRTKASRFQVSIEDNLGWTTGITFDAAYKSGEVDSVTVSNLLRERPSVLPIHLSENAGDKDIMAALPKDLLASVRSILGVANRRSSSHDKIEWRCSRDRFFLTVTANYAETSEAKSRRQLGRYFSGIPIFSFATGSFYGRPFYLFDIENVDPIRTPAHLIQNIIHLPGLRDNPERDYPRTGSGQYFDGPFPAYTASLIYQWKVNEAPELKSLAEFLERMELTHRIDAEAPNDAQVRLKVGRLTHAPLRPPEDVMVDIADVGIGVSQALPILVALLAAKPGQMVYIEQPEIHLHPRAQARLAEIITEIAGKRDLRVIVETHSYIMLRTFQAIVAESNGKGIAPSSVVLHWVTRPDGVTRVDSVELTEAGRFTVPWPEDFSKVARDIEVRYLKAVAKR